MNEQIGLNAKMEETYQREKIGSISHKLKRSMSLFTSDIGYRESCMILYPDKNMHVCKNTSPEENFFFEMLKSKVRVDW